MTYKLTLQPHEKDLSDRKWFMNAYSTIPDWDERDTKEVDRIFEEMFNVKFHYHPRYAHEHAPPIHTIEFLSEADATLFLLRWS